MPEEKLYLLQINLIPATQVIYNPESLKHLLEEKFPKAIVHSNCIEKRVNSSWNAIPNESYHTATL